MGIIHVRGIRCYAYHGCLPEEAVIGAEYKIDVWLQADLDKAAGSDRLEHTIDYCAVHAIVMREMGRPSKLIEHACGRILSALRQELPAVQKAKVRLTKINPPLNGDVRDVSVMLIG